MRPSPSQISALLQSAIQLHGVGNLDQAAALYERVLGLDPRHPDALHLLGVVSLRRGDAVRAEKLILQAIKRNPAPGSRSPTALSISRDPGTACRILAQSAISSGVVLARLLKEAKVKGRPGSAGGRNGAGESGSGR